VNLPAELRTFLRRQAELQDCSVASAMRNIIEDWAARRQSATQEAR